MPWLFLAPALFVLGAFLVYPTLNTLYLSFLDRTSQDFIGWDNYGALFSDPVILTAFRNNLLWLLVFTVSAVFLGLAFAVLFDRVRYERVVKSIVFLPMAISFVGAGVIWKFVYAYKPPQVEQIGLLNALTMGLRTLANDPAWQALLLALLGISSAFALAVLGVSLLRRCGYWIGVPTFAAAIMVLGWLIAHQAGYSPSVVVAVSAGAVAASLGVALLGRARRLLAPFALSVVLSGLALFILDQADFTPQGWLINRPWMNNLALIVVGVWIWTGFCMVILSAAYKGIPQEIKEAARMDGASEWQSFWHVTIPMMKPTIAVVTTTMVINVLKVFDIVYVMTGGQFSTEVIANRMWVEMFTNRNFGRASAIAVILMIAVVPVMVANIRRFREQEAMR